MQEAFDEGARSALQAVVHVVEKQNEEILQLIEKLRDNIRRIETLQVREEQEQQKERQIQELEQYSKVLEALLHVKENREEP